MIEIDFLRRRLAEQLLLHYSESWSLHQELTSSDQPLTLKTHCTYTISSVLGHTSMMIYFILLFLVPLDLGGLGNRADGDLNGHLIEDSLQPFV